MKLPLRRLKGNGTCGHVVEMRHRQTGQLIAVKQVSEGHS
jgi:hypothetical protein